MDLYQQLVDQLPIMIFSLDERDRIVEVNGFFNNKLNYNTGEAVGIPILDVVVESDRERFENICLNAMRKGERFEETEIQFYTKYGVKIDGLVDGVILKRGDESHNLFFFSLRDVTEHKRIVKEIEQMAYHDDLTGLPNRLLFRDRLTMSISQAARMNQHVAVLFLDIDRFKMINDSFGHQVGDKLLAYLAYQLMKNVRKGDTISRFGGDKYMMSIPFMANEEDCFLIGQRILDIMKNPFIVEDHEFLITTSIGISLFPRDSEDVDKLIKCADLAMSRAKQQGGNRFEIYTPSMNEQILRKIGMDRDMRRALEREEFVLFYQPQVSLPEGKIYGAEALLRWMSPERGMIPPLDFIPLAEETGFIVQLGYWILKDACKQLKTWMDSGLPPMTISVNISPRQFMHVDFVTRVREIVQETGVDPKYIGLEITESTMIHDFDSSVNIMRDLINLGITLSVDDFGTGFSSLSLLYRLPIHTVKVDRSFVQQMTQAQDSSIVQAIIAMCHSLNLKVVAEGVETKDQYRLLTDDGCDGIQGYLISKPIPSKDFESFYTNSLIKTT